MEGNPIHDQILRQFEQHQDSLNLNELLQSENDSSVEIQTYSLSPYLSLDQCFTELPRKRDQFSVLSLNAQSLPAKFDQLSAVLSDLNKRNFQFSAICIQETWHRNGDDLNFLTIPGYHMIEQERKCSAHGGLFIYLNEKFSYTIKNLNSNSVLT